MPTKEPPIRGEGPAKRAALEAFKRGKADTTAEVRLKAKAQAKGAAKAKAPGAATVAKLRARVKELEQDKRLLRSALDRAEQQLKGKGVR